MKIEIDEKGSEAFYKEIVNIAAQYRFILKNHHYKLKDYFKQYRILTVTGSVVLGILILMMIFWGVKTLDIAAAAVLSVTLMMCIFYLHNLNRLYKTYLHDDRNSVLTLERDVLESGCIKRGLPPDAAIGAGRRGYGQKLDLSGFYITGTGHGILQRSDLRGGAPAAWEYRPWDLRKC